jgi:hypothetical protein
MSLADMGSATVGLIAFNMAARGQVDGRHFLPALSAGVDNGS